MWKAHLWNLLYRTFRETLVLGGSTPAGIIVIGIIGCSGFGFILTTLIEWRRAGCKMSALKAALRSWPPYVGAVGGVLLAWVVLFSWFLCARIYKDHQALVAANSKLIAENNRLKPPSYLGSPKPPTQTKRKGSPLVIFPSTKIEATTNAPNSMAAGINTGTMIQGDLPPQFKLTKVSENISQNGAYATQFELEVKTERAMLLHVKAVASTLVGDFAIDNKRPASEGGMSFVSTVSEGAGYKEHDYKDIESGTYIITVLTSKPDKVQLQYQ